MPKIHNAFVRPFYSAFFLAGLFSFCAPVQAEVEFDLEVYLDAYYAWDTDSHRVEGEGTNATQVPRRERPLNTIGYFRNELNLNTAQITASVDEYWYRGRTTIQFGGIAEGSWSPAAFRPVQEANLGLRVFGSDTHRLWFDAGVFWAHIGNESFLPKNNWLSTVALLTTYEPFYEAGARLAYSWDERLRADLYVLNGYGTIVDNNSDKTLGWALGYDILDNMDVSWTGLLGNEANAGDPFALRFYNNFNFNYQILEPFGLRSQFDIATEGTKTYYASQVSFHYDFSPEWGVTARGEWIQDTNGMITPDSLDGVGGTLGLEYRPLDNAFIRLEGRHLRLNPNTNQIFMDAQGNTSNQKTEVLVNTGLWF